MKLPRPDELWHGSWVKLKSGYRYSDSLSGAVTHGPRDWKRYRGFIEHIEGSKAIVIQILPLEQFRAKNCDLWSVDLLESAL